MRLAVLVPTRGRLANAQRLASLWRSTRPDASLMLCVDSDDPTWSDDAARLSVVDPEARVLVAVTPPLGSMCAVLNFWAEAVAFTVDAIGFMGDDHLPRSAGWVERICEELERIGGGGIVYGDDLFQGPNIPTAVFMDAEVVRRLGYMAPPELHHMYLDNTWLAWGQMTRRLRYLPDVVIEHLHPQAAGKAVMDENYDRVWALMDADRQRFDSYCAAQLDADVEKLMAIR